MKGQKEQWGKKREEYDVWYEVWSKIEKGTGPIGAKLEKNFSRVNSKDSWTSLIKVEWE